MSSSTKSLRLPFDPTLAQIVEEVVRSHTGGIAGEDVIDVVVGKGHQINEAARALRFLIDRGTVSTGPGLLLFPN